MLRKQNGYVSSRYIPDVREAKADRAHRSPIHIAQQLGGVTSHTSRFYQRFPGILQRGGKDSRYHSMHIHSDLPAYHRHLPACRQDRHQRHRGSQRNRLDCHAAVRSTVCPSSYEKSGAEEITNPGSLSGISFNMHNQPQLKKTGRSPRPYRLITNQK